MSKTVAIVLIIVLAGLVLACAICAPNVLSDKNTFLVAFVGPEFLGVLGVILAITLASSAQLHLEFNKIEEHYKSRGGLSKTRKSVRDDTYALIVLFLIGIALVVFKSLIANSAWSQTIINGAVILVLVANVLLLVSLTRTTFKIPPHIDGDEE
jgi:hypothetical protein